MAMSGQLQLLTGNDTDVNDKFGSSIAIGKAAI